MAAAMRDEPVFGEQAERPPIFRQLPRGASSKEQAALNKVQPTFAERLQMTFIPVNVFGK